jgi:hypothetical protein
MSGFDEGQVLWSDQQLSDKTQNVQESSQTPNPFVVQPAAFVFIFANHCANCVQLDM